MNRLSFWRVVFSIFAGLIVSYPSQAQLVLNEAQSFNLHGIKDDFGMPSDWLELYNGSASSIDLAEYSLTDDPTNLTKWTFANGSIGSGEHLLVFASDRDITSVNSDVEPFEGVTQYFWPYSDSSNETPGTSEVDHLDFTNSLSQIVDGKRWLSASMTLGQPGAIGFSYVGISMQLADWDATPLDFSAYNSFKVLANITAGRTLRIELEHEGTPSWEGHYVTLLGTGEDQWYDLPIVGPEAEKLDLSKIKALVFTMREPYGTTDIRIKDLVFSVEDKYHHTNFKLSRSGEEVCLVNPQGAIVNCLSLPELEEGHTFGLAVDGVLANEVLFSSGSPGASNDNQVGFIDYCLDSLSFSHQAGFYTESLEVSISGSQSIYYTIDGSMPGIDDMPYTAPIEIDQTTVLRAICAGSGELPGATQTHTYLINETIDIPVISLSGEPADFFSHEQGLFSFGPDGDSTTVPYFGSNFWKDWEKPVHVEFFAEDKQRHIAQQAGTSIFGNWSRSADMKSLRLKADSDYGDNDFDYPFFPHKPMKSYKHIVLRNSGGDFNSTMLHDATVQMTVAERTENDYQDYQPCIVFLNGEFWGLYNMREKINEHYIAGNHGVDKDKVDMVEAWGSDISGKNHFTDFHQEIMSKDLTNASAFHSVADSVDLENYVDHFATQLYYNNWDWPQNNLKIWRERGKGKWRYILFDTDLTLGKYDLLPVDSSALLRLTDHETVGINGQIFTQFVKYEPFAHQFINRSADLMNTLFLPDSVLAVLERNSDYIQPYMVRHFNKWRPWLVEVEDYWYGQIDELIPFIEDRPLAHRDDIKEYFDLEEDWEIQLEVDPPGAGVIQVNSIVPERYPWEGVYFQGVPVTLKAIPNPGYSFESWVIPGDAASGSGSGMVSVDLQKDQVVVAQFAGVSGSPELTVSEIQYHPLDGVGQSWWELKNVGEVMVDISRWTYQDENHYHVYELPFGTQLEPGQHLVVVEDTAAFFDAYSDFDGSWVGPTVFGLSNNSDEIHLFERTGEAYLSLRYNDNKGWPTQADGTGPSLERDFTQSDLSQPKTWFAGCPGGSPGAAYNEDCSLNVVEYNTNQWSLYPNPSFGDFAVSWDGDNAIGQLQFFNLAGERVLSRSVQKGAVIRAELSTGVYVLQLAVGDQTMHGRIVVR